eukprot:29440-Pelagococcus_subviridis.AAC.3
MDDTSCAPPPVAMDSPVVSTTCFLTCFTSDSVPCSASSLAAPFAAFAAAFAGAVAAVDVPNEAAKAMISSGPRTMSAMALPHVALSTAAPMPQFTQPVGGSPQHTGPTPSKPSRHFL